MSYESNIHSALAADSTLLATLTGGIYTWSSSGRNGISRQSTPSAFSTSTGKLKPCALVKVRSQVPTRDIRDEVTKVTSLRAVVEIWFYDDGAATTSAIETAMNRVFALLHDSRVTGARVRWLNQIDSEREPLLDNAHLFRSDYEVLAVRS